MKETDGDSRPRPPLLLDKVRRAVRARHFGPAAEASFLRFIRRFIIFHNKGHPRGLGTPEIRTYLNHLGREAGTGSPTVERGLRALVFLYREVLEIEPLGLEALISSYDPRLLADLPTRDELRALIDALPDSEQLIVLLITRHGLSALECLRLRLEEADEVRGCLILHRSRGRGGKGASPEARAQVRQASTRIQITLSEVLRPALAAQCARVRSLCVGKPSLGRGRSMGATPLFPGASVAGILFPIHPEVLERSIRDAARRAGLTVRITCATLRHAWAAHLLEDGHDPSELRRRLGSFAPGGQQCVDQPLRGRPELR